MKVFGYYFWMAMFALMPAFIVGVGVAFLFDSREVGLLALVCVFGFGIDVLNNGTKKAKEVI